jgi:hypothetical protein
MNEHDIQAPAKNSGEKQHLFDNPANVKRVLVVLYAACALLLLADFVLHRHIEHPLEELPGFYAVYGFVGCVALVVAAKELRRLVMRPEDYYDE